LEIGSAEPDSTHGLQRQEFESSILLRFGFFFCFFLCYWAATERLLGGYWVATGWLLGGLLVVLLGGYWGYWAPEHPGLLGLLGLLGLPSGDWRGWWLAGAEVHVWAGTVYKGRNSSKFIWVFHSNF